MQSYPSKSSSQKLILLVDDSHVHQYSLTKHLQDSGFSVAQARTGEEALRLTMEQRPDVVLLDIHLPDINGFEVCQRLKQQPETAEIPVVFHSATYDAQTAKGHALDLGAMSFLTYPLDVNHLVSVLRGAIAQSRKP
jgi:CheY-like chemotaxis protein